MQKTQETQVESLGREDPLEEEMATHSSILAPRIPWTEEPGGLQFVGCTESDMTEATQRKKRPKGTHASLKMYGVYLVPYSARNPLKFKKKKESSN